MLLFTGSTSSGAPCSKGGVIFALPVFPSGKFPSYAMMQLCMVLTSLVLDSPGRCLLWHTSPFLRQDL